MINYTLYKLIHHKEHVSKFIATLNVSQFEKYESLTKQIHINHIQKSQDLLILRFKAIQICWFLV